MLSLRDEVSDADARAFAGRARALEAVDHFLTAGSPHRFLFVHGAGGIGKSALLREIARRGSVLGYAVARGPTIPDGVSPDDQPLLLVADDIPQLAVEAARLRDRLLDCLPAGTRVVLASRERPHPDWWRDGLDALVRELHLDPLPDDDARCLLMARGLLDAARQDEVISWAHGSPLGLVVGAAIAAGATAVGSESLLEDRLAGWLAGAQIEGVDPDVLEVAALTSPVDSRLLAAALPGRSMRGVMAQLWDLPVVSRTGHAAELHPALRTAIATRLRADQGARYRELVRRIALHLDGRAHLGDCEALVQLSGLIESPSLISGTARSGSRTHVADSLRPGDVEELSRVGAPASPTSRAFLDWFLDRFPAHTTVVRRADGSLAGMVGAAPLAAIRADGSAPARDIADILVHEGCDPGRSLAGPAIILETAPDALTEFLRVGFSSALRRGGVADLRHWFMHLPIPAQRPIAFLTAAPWRAVRLWTEDSSWLMDWGSSGAVGFALNTVLREQGYGDRAGDASLLAVGAEARLAAALGRIFGESHEERQLRRVIELAHLSPGLTQAQILRTLHVSRATYFRLLRRARERVLEG